MPWYGDVGLGAVAVIALIYCLMYFARQNTRFMKRIDELRIEYDARYDEKAQRYEERMDKKNEQVMNALQSFERISMEFNTTIRDTVQPAVESLTSLKDAWNRHDATWDERVRDEYRTSIAAIMDTLAKNTEALCKICERLEINGEKHKDRA